ncbi:SPOR domain-containing protein [Desulfovibrio mangrovi]|uniref:SPOR domain-containing protein n=1 Tax=Desulfovibrio mangrovi TaxID=2976983 RepID=UPI002245A8C1|nr:SPOR domain-containing protein [Desulfovibrio mangrovi]UZP67421.1 SPOR domain-containing protein [Desulfovibrio mangrovi]
MNRSTRSHLTFGFAAMLFTAFISTAIMAKWIIFSVEPALVPPSGGSFATAPSENSRTDDTASPATSSLTQEYMIVTPAEAASDDGSRQPVEPVLETAAGPVETSIKKSAGQLPETATLASMFPLPSQFSGTPDAAPAQTGEALEAAPQNKTVPYKTPDKSPDKTINRTSDKTTAATMAAPQTETAVAANASSPAPPAPPARAVPSHRVTEQQTKQTAAKTAATPVKTVPPSSKASKPATVAASQPNTPRTTLPAIRPAAATGTLWLAHTGSYQSRAEAFTERGRLSAAGFTAEVIVLYDTRQRAWYSLLAGTGASRQAAEAICTRYKSARNSPCAIRSFTAAKYKARAERARR